MPTKIESIIVTPVSIDCNLRCVYCFHHTKQLDGVTSGRMTLDTLDQMIDQAAAAHQVVNFIWHGGEPTLAGLDFYRHAVERQAMHPDVVFTNFIQTNGTTLTPKWIQFFKENNFQVGVTLDGPESVHDQQRFFVNGRGTFQTVLDKAEAALKELPVGGFLSVITRHSLGHAEEIFNLFADRGLSFDILPYYESDLAVRECSELTITGAEYAAFITELFDLWIERDDPNVKIRSFNLTVRAILGQEPAICRMSGRCASYISVDANGDVYPCDRFAGEAELKLGNLHDTAISDLMDSPQHQKFAAVVHDYPDACKECRWFRICNGDCTHYRYHGNGNFADVSYYCEAQKAFFEHVERWANTLVPTMVEPEHAG